MLRSPMKRRVKSTGPDAQTVELIMFRALYQCEICGAELATKQRGRDYSIHHRRARRMGGTSWPGSNLPSNLMLICGDGTTGCHGLVESRRAWAVREGHLVPSTLDPAQVAVLIQCATRWVYLTDDGGYALDPPPRSTA